MKNLFLLLVGTLILFTTTNAQIPNNGFENWTSVGSYSNPENWDQLNAMTAGMSIYTCTKGTPGNPGNSYLKLVSKNVSGMGVMPGIAVSGVIDITTFKAKSGFAFSQRPAQLTGNWQYMASGADGGFIAAYLTKWDATMKMRDTIAKVTQNLSGMVMNWEAFNLNLTYSSNAVPDSAIIILSSSGLIPVANSYLYIDDLAFQGTVTGINTVVNPVSFVSVFPNPSNDFLTIEVTTEKIVAVKIELFDLLGKVIKEINTEKVLGLYKTTINTQNLSKGTYLFKISSDGMEELKKVVIQ